jgi:hypothetical protein
MIEPSETTLKKNCLRFCCHSTKERFSAEAAPFQGYLMADEQNRVSFTADAKLFDWCFVADQLATSALLEQGPNGNWVESSSKIEYVKAGGRP